MKKYLCILFLIILFLFPIISIYAHPGRTDGSGCHYCRTNCEKWGLEYNEYHCHNSKSSNSSSSYKRTGKTTSKTNSDNTFDRIMFSIAIVFFGYEFVKDKFKK